MTVPPKSSGREGFTLIEALVALTILAIASAGLIRATEAHVDQVRGLQTRTIAQWIAENHLIELELDPTGLVDRTDRVEMLGRTWDVSVRAGPSEDPDLSTVTVAVSLKGANSSAAVLTGFIDTGRSAV